VAPVQQAALLVALATAASVELATREPTVRTSTPALAARVRTAQPVSQLVPAPLTSARVVAATREPLVKIVPFLRTCFHSAQL